jgi:hypothetical protein
MTFVDQDILHAEGEVGNCLQATLASILGRPIEEVPHFALLGESHWWDCLVGWLNLQGFWVDYAPDTLIEKGARLLPLCWLSGESARGFQHAVVGDSATGEMLHDPHPSRAGLLEVAYRLYFFQKPRRA